MGLCDLKIIAKAGDIENLAKICEQVGKLLRTKCEPDGNSEFIDWTGISNFLLFHKPDERTLPKQGISGEGVENICAAEWVGEEWNEDEAALWWWEIAWSHKVPSEIWQFMRQESKKLGVQQLVENLIREWGVVGDTIFDLVEREISETSVPMTES
jgi:hypothetical protein